jgi:hypothetical protein
MTPGSGEYEAARKVYNGMIDRRPRVIIRCADVADIREAVLLARQEFLTVAIRGGAYNEAGLGVCDNGLVIDLSAMKGSESIRPDARLAPREALPGQKTVAMKVKGEQRKRTLSASHSRPTLRRAQSDFLPVR